MSMYRRHFNAIADAIARARAVEPDRQEWNAALDAVARNLANVCRQENGAFQVDRFLHAAGVTQ